MSRHRKLASESKEIPVSTYASVIDKIKDVTEVLNITNTYRSRLENYGLRNPERTWIKNSDIDIVTSNAVGYLHFVKFSSRLIEDIPEDV